MKKIAITLIEKDNSECPNIGTVVGDDESILRIRAVRALESHFDAEITSIKIQDGLDFMDIENSPPLDAIVGVLGFHGEEELYEIELQQTWIYQ